MLKKLLALFIGGFLCTTLLGYWTTVQARPTQMASSAIALPLNKATDGAALLPTNRSVSAKPYDDGRVVIGNDDRSPVLSRNYPWSAIGRLEWHVAGEVLPWCTATLIGEDLLLTNSHCLERPVVDPKTGRLAVDPNNKQLITRFTDSATYLSGSDKLVFKPSLIKGTSLDEAKVVSYRSGWTKNSQDVMNKDWALLKIDQRLGAANRYGYIGWRSLDFSNPNIRKATANKIQLAGYSGDFPTDKLREFGEAGDTAGVDTSCSILDAAKGVLFHDCDTYPGASGSAIFALFDDDKYYILGLHAGSNQLNRIAKLPDGIVTKNINRGVQVAQWSTQAIAMRQ